MAPSYLIKTGQLNIIANQTIRWMHKTGSSMRMHTNKQIQQLIKQYTLWQVMQLSTSCRVSESTLKCSSVLPITTSHGTQTHLGVGIHSWQTTF